MPTGLRTIEVGSLLVLNFVVSYSELVRTLFPEDYPKGLVD
jgi:hypothetical protein